MPKIEMNKEQSELFNDVKKLVKRANQRILVLERLTGEKGTFATKQLYDYLSVTDGISKTGRIKLSKKAQKGLKNIKQVIKNTLFLITIMFNLLLILKKVQTWYILIIFYILNTIIFMNKLEEL